MTAPRMQFQPAKRRSVKLKLAIQGPAGSGKTKGALHLARSIVGPTGRIAVIDTENRTSEFYADQYRFDVLYLEPPYLTTKFIEAMLAAHQGGYDIVVIDTISHQWMGEGGILDRKEQEDARGGNHFANWAKFTPETNRFRDAILNFPRHLICTMRAKQEYVLAENAKGKQEPKKMGLAPQVREGLDYEFGVVFELQMDHMARQTKDRTELFKDGLWNLLDDNTGGMLRTWLSTATEPEPDKQQSAAAAPNGPETIMPRLKDFPGVEGKRLRDISDEELEAMYRFYQRAGNKPRLTSVLEDELQRRTDVDDSRIRDESDEEINRPGGTTHTARTVQPSDIPNSIFEPNDAHAHATSAPAGAAGDDLPF